jgi:hypothetical protein
LVIFELGDAGMKKTLVAVAAFAAMICFAAPAAAAVTLLPPLNCNLLTGCLFSDNDNDAAAIEAAYNTAHVEPPNPAILDLPALFQKTELSGSTLTANWTSSFLVTFISVKAGDNFMLYQLATPAMSGSLSSLGLNNNNGQQQGISHYTLWGGGQVVPEPATWAMMILGFAMVGFGLRMRRRTEATPA